MKKSLLFLCLTSPAFAGSVTSGGGGLAITAEPIRTNALIEEYDFQKNDFTLLVTGSLQGKPLKLNNELVKPDNLDFKNRTISLRSLSVPAKTILIKELPLEVYQQELEPQASDKSN